jgi:fimbrial isopeptide formation D2 family protein
LAETEGATNTGTYASSLACNNGTTATGTAGTFTVPSSPTNVICTFTNTRTSVTTPTVSKTVTSNQQNPDGSWTIVYDIAVTNPAALGGPTAFRLTDTLDFGQNIKVNSASVTGTGANPSWNGSTDTTVVAAGPLAAGATEHYTVTVNATVLASATASDRTCSAGGGFHNVAQVGAAADPAASASLATDQASSACADPGSPTVMKKVMSVVAGATPGQWTVTYAVTVANGTSTQVSYSLGDDLGFPAGVTVRSTSASRVHSALDGSGATGAEPIPGWSGTDGGTGLASTQLLAPRSKDTYTVVVGVTVASGLAPDVTACSATGPGHGYFNAATLTSGSDQFGAQACAPIMPPAPPSSTPPPTVAPPTPSTGPPSTTPAVAAPSPAPPSVAQSQEIPPAAPASLTSPTPQGLTSSLPFTGLSLVRDVIVAATLVGVGAVLLLVSRRRRMRGEHPMHTS